MKTPVLRVFGAQLRLGLVNEDAPKRGYWLWISAPDRSSHRAAFDFLVATVPRRHRRWRRYAPPDGTPAWWISRRGAALLHVAAGPGQAQLKP